MFVKILGLFDLLSGIVLILAGFNLIGWLALIFSIYLFVKALFFIGDWTSFIDIFAGVFILLAIFGVYNIFSWIFVIWLLQKSFFSLLS